MNLKTEKSRLDLFYEAARIYLLKVNASHTKIQWSNDQTIIVLGWAKYHDLSLYRKLIICLGLWFRQIMNLLATDKSRYFAQPSPIIVYYCASFVQNPRPQLLLQPSWAVLFKGGLSVTLG